MVCLRERSQRFSQTGFEPWICTSYGILGIVTICIRIRPSSKILLCGFWGSQDLIQITATTRLFDQMFSVIVWLLWSYFSRTLLALTYCWRCQTSIAKSLTSPKSIVRKERFYPNCSTSRSILLGGLLLTFSNIKFKLKVRHVSATRWEPKVPLPTMPAEIFTSRNNLYSRQMTQTTLQSPIFPSIMGFTYSLAAKVAMNVAFADRRTMAIADREIATCLGKKHSWRQIVEKLV